MTGEKVAPLRPESVNILGKTYSVTYVDKPSDVDIYSRDSMWGQVDYWTHSIRVYAPKGFSQEEILDTLLHEILHVISHKLKLKALDENHDDLGLVAMALADTILRNGWLAK